MNNMKILSHFIHYKKDRVGRFLLVKAWLGGLLFLSPLTSCSKEDEPEFDRLNHLITMVGGISYMMQGVEAALNAMVIDMMKEFKKAKEQIAEQDSKE